MAHFTYTDTRLRPDLPQAYLKTWEIIGAPGNWWTAAERLAIAREVRKAHDCAFCAARKAALSPYGVSGQHDSDGGLPEAVIDAVHRITTDATRLSESYVRELAEQGVSDGHYVEMLGIVVALISIDEFNAALGLNPEPLPVPGANEAPSHYRPPGAKDHGAWVATVAPADLADGEADLYGGAPQTGNVLSAMSLVPDSVRLLNVLGAAQYLRPDQVADPGADGGRAITRSQMELLAGRVAAINECFY